MASRIWRIDVGGRPPDVHITTNGLTYRYDLYIGGGPAPGEAAVPSADGSAVPRRRGRLALWIWSLLVVAGLGWAGWAGMQALAAYGDEEAFVHALPCEAGIPEPCRRVLPARVVETHAPGGRGDDPWVRLSLPNGQTLLAVRAGADDDGLVTDLRPGDEVRVQTWRGDVVALRDVQGRIMGTHATPRYRRLNWIMVAMLGLPFGGLGVSGLCAQVILRLAREN